MLLNTLSCVLETCFNAAGRIALADVLVALRRLIFPVVSLIGLTALNGTPWLFLPLGGVFSLMACLLLTAIRLDDTDTAALAAIYYKQADSGLEWWNAK